MLAFNVSPLNLVSVPILRHSLQQYQWIYANWSSSKLKEKETHGMVYSDDLNCYPDLTFYLFVLLSRLYVALGTLTEPHQLTATLNCVTSVARALVRPDASYPAGRSHVLPLLQLVLPGIDPNDFRKALVSTILKWPKKYMHCGLSEEV